MPRPSPQRSQAAPPHISSQDFGLYRLTETARNRVPALYFQGRKNFSGAKKKSWLCLPQRHGIRLGMADRTVVHLSLSLSLSAARALTRARARRGRSIWPLVSVFTSALTRARARRGRGRGVNFFLSFFFLKGGVGGFSFFFPSFFVHNQLRHLSVLRQRGLDCLRRAGIAHLAPTVRRIADVPPFRRELW